MRGSVLVMNHKRSSCDLVCDDWIRNKEERFGRQGPDSTCPSVARGYIPRGMLSAILPNMCVSEWHEGIGGAIRTGLPRLCTFWWEHFRTLLGSAFGEMALLGTTTFHSQKPVLRHLENQGYVPALP